MFLGSFYMNVHTYTCAYRHHMCPWEERGKCEIVNFHRTLHTHHPKAAKQIVMQEVQKCLEQGNMLSWQLHWTFYFHDKCHPKHTDSFQRGLHRCLLLWGQLSGSLWLPTGVALQFPPLAQSLSLGSTESRSCFTFLRRQEFPLSPLPTILLSPSWHFRLICHEALHFYFYSSRVRHQTLGCTYARQVFCHWAVPVSQHHASWSNVMKNPMEIPWYAERNSWGLAVSLLLSLT
jgi:hypothetical protein